MQVSPLAQAAAAGRNLDLIAAKDDKRQGYFINPCHLQDHRSRPQSQALHGGEQEGDAGHSADYTLLNGGDTRRRKLDHAGRDSRQSFEVLIDRESQRTVGYASSANTTASSPFGSRSALRKARSKSTDNKAHVRIGAMGVLKQSWMLSWMFVFIPLGFVAFYFKAGAVTVFCLNFLAIVPQAWIMGKATEDLAAASGAVIGGLLNAWFGNIVEMLLCVAGLRQGELVVVRCTLIGSILSNLLFVTGCALFFGGMKYKIQQFSAIGASTSSSLLMLGVFCASLPTIYVAILSGTSSAQEEVLRASRAVSLFLIAMYLQYMLFQLGTHNFLFTDEGDDDGDMSPTSAGVVLAICTVLCTFNSEYLISSVQGVVASVDLSKEFIGIVLLPIIGNAAEHYTSVIVALSNKMDLSLGCAVGSSCQMLLFVTPVTVVVGWAIGQPMNLNLHAFEILILIICVIIITGILQDGYSNWLEGSILLTAYAVIAMMYFWEDPKFSDII